MRSRFETVEDALKHIEEPRSTDETKWEALAVVMRELFKAAGYDLEAPLN